MMKFKKIEIVEIDENEIAEELAEYLETVLEYHDREFARTIDEETKLKILNKVGEIWLYS